MSKWQKASYLRATTGGPTKTEGYAYAGLGLHYDPPEWVVTHLGTGHSVCRISLARFAAEVVATEIADCGDWDWSGLKGFQNKDPEILKRARAIAERLAPDISWYQKGRPGRPDLVPSEEVAREIAEANA